MNSLELHTELYSYDALMAAVKAFSAICRIQIEPKNAHFVCTFTDCLYDTKETMKEFENYVIDWLNAGGAACL